MPFNIRCQSCKKDNSPELDTKTKKVYCSECQQEISNITSFQIEIIKASGQILRNNYKHESFTVDCKKCNRIGKPVHTNDGKIACSICNQELDHLSDIYCHMLKQNIAKQRK